MPQFQPFLIFCTEALFVSLPYFPAFNCVCTIHYQCCWQKHLYKTNGSHHHPESGPMSHFTILSSPTHCFNLSLVGLQHYLTTCQSKNVQCFMTDLCICGGQSSLSPCLDLESHGNISLGVYEDDSRKVSQREEDLSMGNATSLADWKEEGTWKMSIHCSLLPDSRTIVSPDTTTVKPSLSAFLLKLWTQVKCSFLNMSFSVMLS